MFRPGVLEEVGGGQGGGRDPRTARVIVDIANSVFRYLQFTVAWFVRKVQSEVKAREMGEGKILSADKTSR